MCSIVVREEKRNSKTQPHTLRWHLIRIIECLIGSTACAALALSSKIVAKADEWSVKRERDMNNKKNEEDIVDNIVLSYWIVPAAINMSKYNVHLIKGTQ